MKRRLYDRLPDLKHPGRASLPASRERMPVRTLLRARVVKTWSCIDFEFMSFSLYHLRAVCVFFPPLAKGGLGGVVPAKSITGFSEIRRLNVSALLLAPSRRNRKSTRGIRAVRPHPPWPPLHKGGKVKAPASPYSNSAQQKRALRNRPFSHVNTNLSPPQPRPPDDCVATHAARTIFRVASLALFSALLLIPRGNTRGDEPKTFVSLSQRMRHPAALALIDSGKTLLVANHRSGSLSVIDTASQKVVAEDDVGGGLADLAMLPGGRLLLAVDQVSNKVLLIDVRDRKIRVVDRIKVSPDPVRVVVPADGSICIVASLWSRRLTFIGLARRRLPTFIRRFRSSAPSICRSARVSWPSPPTGQN